MKSEADIARRYLRAQKKRTVLLVLGVTLAIALLSTLFSMFNLLQQMEVHNYEQEGVWHIMASNCTSSQASVLQKRLDVSASGKVASVGGQPSLNGIEIQQLSGADAGGLAQEHLKIASGSVPSGVNQIALQEWVVKKVKPGAKLGSTLLLTLNGQTKQVTLVGILQERSTDKYNEDAEAWTSLETAQTFTGKDQVDVLMQVRNNVSIRSFVQALTKENGIPSKNVVQHKTLLAALGRSDGGNMMALYGACAILGALVLFAAVVMIYNAFNMSVKQRMRQFGLLRALGATPAQIRRMVRAEALQISVFGVLPGVVLGAVVTILLNILFKSLLPEILGPDGPWIFVSWPALVLGAALGIICTVLSAFRPAARAGKVSPVEAIASVSGGSTKKKTIRGKSTKWMPIEAAIAFRQIGMRKRSFLLTAVSLSFGILLLLSFSPLTNFIQLGLRNNADLGDVYAAMPVGQSSFSDAQLSSMKSIAGVASVSAQRITQVKATFRYDLLGSNYRENKASWKSVAKDNNGMIQTQTPSTMVGMSNENIRNLKADVLYGSMDPAKLNSENGIILMLNMMSKSSVNVGDLRPGNTIQVQGKNMKIGAIVMANTALQYYAGNTFISFYTTNQVFQQFSAARPNMAALTLHSGVNGNNVYTTLKRQLSTVPKVQVGNQQLAKQLSGRISLVSNILFYGFIAIILLIGVLNIINTIGTNVLVRTREIGLLRAGGMTIKQVRNMLVYESACYGVLALGIGLVVGLPLERFFYRNMVQLTFGVPWSLPWVLMIVVSVVTIAAVFLSLVSPLKQMRQMEITRAVTIE